MPLPSARPKVMPVVTLLLPGCARSILIRFHLRVAPPPPAPIAMPQPIKISALISPAAK